MSDEVNVTAEAPETTEEVREVVFEEALEAILFAAGHPISYQTLARVFEMTPGKVKDKVFEYSIKYNDPEIPRGVILLTFADSCQLCTKQNYLPEIRDALGIKKSGTLSTSSMEVLAIIAYNQPVTRAFVDTLRRVDSSYAMSNLLDRGLIVSKGRLDVPGRPMLYGTTSDFLRCFGLKDLESLPKTSDELMDVFNGAKSAEAESNTEQADAVESAQIEADIDSALPNAEASEENASESNKQGEYSAEDELHDEYSAEDDLHDNEYEDNEDNEDNENNEDNEDNSSED